MARASFGQTHANLCPVGLFYRRLGGQEYLGRFIDHIVVAELIGEFNRIIGRLSASSSTRRMGLPCVFGQTPFYIGGHMVNHWVHVRLFKEVACAVHFLMCDCDAALFL